MTSVELFETEQARAAAQSGTQLVSADNVFLALETALIEQQDFHRLFDAKLIRIRRNLGLPITQPTSLKDIPREHELIFREAYKNAARDVGQLFLNVGQLADAWAYFRTIQEPDAVREAISRKIAELPAEPGPQTDDMLNLALYEGAHVVEGLRLLLKTHGICNTVTAMGQMMAQMTPSERREAAALMVRSIYSDLQHNVRRDLERRLPLLKPNQSLAELIRGREFLFADGGYHVDVSHLHSIVSFARHLQKDDPELIHAIELAQYGGQLAEHLRYPADVPFDDYYAANEHFLKAVAGIDVDDSMAWFADRLDQEPDASDQRMIAFVLVDLGQRVGRIEMALEKASVHLNRLEDPNGFSFAACCVQAGRIDLLESAARNNDDVLALATAILAKTS
ncbi:MAG: hypothetical protein ACK58L_17875 [Planctomycetota bacterium]